MVEDSPCFLDLFSQIAVALAHLSKQGLRRRNAYLALAGLQVGEQLLRLALVQLLS